MKHFSNQMAVAFYQKELIETQLWVDVKILILNIENRKIL